MRAVVVEHKDKKYVVNDRNQIISVTTGDLMMWGDENGDRKAILALSKAAFEAKQKAETSTTNTRVVTEGVKDREQLFNDMRSKLARKISVGRSGYLSVMATPNDHNGAPIITVSVYNSASDMATDTQYRLNANGNLESRFKWSNEEWKENWQEKPSEYDAVNEFFNALKSSAAPEAPNTINQDNNLSNNNQINYGNDFRRVQETVRGSSKEGQQSISGRNIPLNRRPDLADVLRRELGSIDSFAHGSTRALNNQKHGTSFILHTEVDPQLFHDFFEIVRFYTDNGELVDLHEDYTGCKCYLTEDGTAGFAIEPNGNLVSVFNLGTTKGFLSAAKEVILESGATHLDAYASSNQNLRLMYEKLLGAKVASSMDYNMEFDHDDIAKNHGNPQVVFMVIGEAAKGEVKEKHFDKDSYNDAVSYQLSFLKDQQFKPETNPILEQFKKDIDLLAGYFEGGGAYITDVLPNLSEELQNKLDNDFMGGKELTLEDYRDLWQAIEFVDTGGKFPEVRERKVPVSSTPSSAASSLNVGSTEGLAAGGASLGFVPNATPAGNMEDVYQRLAQQAATQNPPAPNKPKPERPKSVAYESALKPNDSRVARFKRTFSPQQIKDRGAMIADKFSNIIDNALWDEIDACLDVIESETASEAVLCYFYD